MKSVNLTIVKSWDEITRKQLLFLCRLFLAKLDLDDFRLQAFLYLTKTKALPDKIITNGIVYWIFKTGKSMFMLTREELAWYMKSVDFITQNCRLTVNHFPAFSLPLKRFFGPSVKCYNMSYLEFIHAENWLYAYQKSNDLKHLNTLCSVLYRPGKRNFNPLDPDYNGDRREPFNDFIYQKRAWRFRFIGIRKKFAIYLFYTGCRNVMIDSFPNLFKGDVVSSEPVNPVNSLRKIINDLNMGDITRNDKIYKMQVWEAFEHLEHLIENLPKKKKHGKV